MSNVLAEDLDHVLAHTACVWDELKNARIFLTGGTGFFGCWLLETFAWASDRLRLDAAVTVLTRSPAAFRRKAPHLASHPAIHLAEGDVRSFHLPASRFSHVIHAAADATPELCREQPLLVTDTIVDGTRRTLDFAVEAGARRFLFTSSGAVYGPQPPEITHVPETYSGGPDTTDQRWVYAEAKRAAEMLCNVYTRQRGLDCLIARGFAFVGPYMPLDAHFAIGNFIRDHANGGPIRVNGDGSPFRSYLYAADLAIWLWTILVQGASCRPYNVGSERELNIAELAAKVAAALETRTAIRMAGSARPGTAPERYVPDTSRARRELGLEERVSLDEAIRRTAEWYSLQAACAGKPAARVKPTCNLLT